MDILNPAAAEPFNSGWAGFAPPGVPDQVWKNGVKELKCPTWDGKEKDLWRHMRRKIHTWSLAGTVHLAFQAAILLDS